MIGAFSLRKAVMSIDLSSQLELKPAFPAAAIAACLQDELIHIVKDLAEIHEITLPNTQAAIVTASFVIDSLDVVGILCKLDELLGFELPHSVVCAGGYETIDQAIHDLMPRVEKVWLKRNGGTA
jgi:hypothetical protein